MEIAPARATQVKSAVKRRKLDSNLENLNQCSCLIDSSENPSSPATTSLSPNQIPENSNEFHDNSSRSADLKVENVKTNNSTFINRELTPSSMSDVMETTTKTKKTKNKASSAQMPSMAEIEEFFSVAEKNEAKRFTEKYNYDIVKDVPLQGKYQWVRINQ